MNPKNLLMFILVFPLISSFIGFALGKKNESYRKIFYIIMTGITFAVVAYLYKYVALETIEISVPHIMGTGLHLKLDVFRYIFVFITTFVWFLVTIYSTQYLISYKNRNRYYLFFMLTLWSTIGIFISENILNLFTFFEIMSLTSYALVIHDEDEYAHEAGDTYIVMAVTGGLILLMGLFLLYNYTQTFEISELQHAVANLGRVKYLISVLIIIGFGVKAGMFPLHIWLPKAHPAAPAPASAILSGILVKTGIFGIIIVVNIMMAGDVLLSAGILVMGFITMFIGGFLAMFQRNIKRILAYSTMSQVGYILVGIGLIGLLKDHKVIAIYGTLFHIINHAIFKVLLFMGVGVVYMVLHELSINKIGGFGRDKTALKIIFLIGLLAIIGMPGFNGYTGKTLLHSALSEAHHMYGGIWFTIAEVVFTASSSFTVAYLLKIFVAVFVEKSDHNIEKAKTIITKRALFPIGVLAAVVVYIGLRPETVLHLIEKAVEPFGNIHHNVHAHFYSGSHVMSAIFTILLGVAVYFFFVRKFLRKGTGEHWWYENPALNWFNIENHVYKPAWKVVFFVSSVVLKAIDVGLIQTVAFFSNIMKLLATRELNYGKAIKGTLEEALDSAVELTGNVINKGQEKVDENISVAKNLSQGAQQLGHKMNSITYSVFIFAVVLVVCLLVMIQF
ncbi:complex I subunit 5 family protein [Clostridium sp. ZS2-4]|uniref:complex I subunit 5 family protein n=1 Tax=Clostridium sp. ZS2-4 TaxID=2987703 RepID=UPI00227C3685|nr:complex I subunit 5 family protein [Clostridium sp. ZS2-4]MCY6355215.1 complex I subunit 5 family protein [Clostridium sp. ZS2-4]